jgi:lipoate-protein ligase A
LEWFKEKAEASSVAEVVVTLNDELLMEYWEKAENIIAEFNEYGGGPEDEEEEAYQWLNEISELIRKGIIPQS